MERHFRAVVGVLKPLPPRSNRPRPVDLEDLCTRIVYAVRRPRGRYCRTSRGITIKRTWVCGRVFVTSGTTAGHSGATRTRRRRTHQKVICVALRRLHPTLRTLACASRPDSDTPGKPHWPTMEPASTARFHSPLPRQPSCTMSTPDHPALRNAFPPRHTPRWR